MHVYPFPSQLKNQLRDRVGNFDYRIWQSKNIQTLVEAISSPVIEIGGPTLDGFYFLDDIKFKSKLTITNISHNPMPFSADSSKIAKQVVEVFDATKMPYPDKSIGVFLMAAMSITSDWWVELPGSEKEKASSQFEAEFANARFEMGQVAAGILDPQDVKDAQRIKIYHEVARCLEKDGLFFTDGGIEEITILKQLGFELLACLQLVEGNGFSYEFVVAKRFEPQVR